MTGGEFATPEALSRAQGVSKQAVLMRAVLTGGTEAAARLDELRESLAATRLQLQRLGTNVNQLAHQANAFALNGGTPVSVDEVRRVARRIEDTMAALEQIARDAEGARDAR